MTTNKDRSKDTEVPYHGRTMPLHLPPQAQLTTIRPQQPKVGTPWEEHLSVYWSSAEWTSLLTKAHGKTMLVVVNDATRATPTALLLRKLVPLLHEQDVIPRFIVATGSHRPPTQEELKVILGDYYDQYHARTLVHDAKDDANLTFVGETSFGTPVWVNKVLLDEEVGGVVAVNSVEPHYFAGWTGGRKSIIPGIAGYQTITATHKHALEPTSQTCKLDGNPVHDDFMECFDLIVGAAQKPITSFQFIIDSEGVIHDLVSGHPTEALTEAVAQAGPIFQSIIPHKFDLVIAVATPPLDQNLYQAHKGLENTKLATKEGGDILLVASCWDGVGPDSFLEPLQSDLLNHPTLLLAEIREHYKLGYHKAAKLVEGAERYHIALLSELPDEVTEMTLFRPVHDLQQWVEERLEGKDSPEVLVVYDACLTVPTLET